MQQLDNKSCINISIPILKEVDDIQKSSTYRNLKEVNAKGCFQTLKSKEVFEFSVISQSNQNGFLNKSNSFNESKEKSKLYLNIELVNLSAHKILKLFLHQIDKDLISKKKFKYQAVMKIACMETFLIGLNNKLMLGLIQSNQLILTNSNFIIQEIFELREVHKVFPESNGDIQFKYDDRERQRNIYINFLSDYNRDYALFTLFRYAGITIRADCVDIFHDDLEYFKKLLFIKMLDSSANFTMDFIRYTEEFLQSTRYYYKFKSLNRKIEKSVKTGRIKMNHLLYFLSNHELINKILCLIFSSFKSLFFDLSEDPKYLSYVEMVRKTIKEEAERRQSDNRPRSDTTDINTIKNRSRKKIGKLVKIKAESVVHKAKFKKITFIIHMLGFFGKKGEKRVLDMFPEYFTISSDEVNKA